MGSNVILLCRIALLLWVLCVAVGELQKRDVHRIVIKERVPRSHKKGQGHGHTHKGHGYNRKNKKGRNPHKNQEPYSNSYEDRGSYSGENSDEDIVYGRQLQKPYYKKKTSQNRPVYPINLEMEESRNHHYKEELKPHLGDEWVPLNTEQVLQHYQENHRNKHKRKNIQENKTKSRNPKSKETKNTYYILEHTTAYPPLHFDTSTLYPPLSIFPSTFSNYNGEILESNQSPLSISSFEQPKIGFSNSKGSSDRLRNHRTSYYVKEADESDIGTFILVPDSNSGSKHEQDLKHTLKVRY